VIIFDRQGIADDELLMRQGLNLIPSIPDDISLSRIPIENIPILMLFVIAT